MTATPLLSVIIPNFNNAAYLDECLGSVFEQTFRDFEVIVTDDASSDASPDRIRAWRLRHASAIRAIFHPVNRGVPTNLHQAIEQSRGAWLTTLDSDDYYTDPGKLEREMAVVRRREAAGKTAIAFSDTLLVRDDRTPICLNSSYAPLREGSILPDVLARSCLIPRDFIMPRSAYFAVGGYDPRVLLYDDWDLKIRLAERYPFHFSGGTGTAYRQHGRGIASRPPNDHIIWLNRVFENNLNRAEAAQHQEIRAGFGRFMADIARRARG
jgi:glycosyltransferase involved in cell wall biosynthesis